jgi:hypothetical protein
MASKENSGGITFIGALTLLFIGLKLGEVIEWSWLWVLSPFWIPLAVILPIAFTIYAVVSISGYFERRAALKNMYD